MPYSLLFLDTYNILVEAENYSHVYKYADILIYVYAHICVYTG